ncbi:hypothetical protein [Halorussus sp. MSC15.2]|nr:hypothetical protein [Halorussus sp. MSC15.2]
MVSAVDWSSVSVAVHVAARRAEASAVVGGRPDDGRVGVVEA